MKRRCRHEANRTFFIFHVAKQRFIAEGCFMSCYATRLMHRRCASLQPKRRPMSGKVICGECGGSYGPLLWHSTTYRNCVWECFEKIRKSQCHCSHIYDEKMQLSPRSPCNVYMIKIRKYCNYANNCCQICKLTI